MKHVGKTPGAVRSRHTKRPDGGLAEFDPRDREHLTSLVCAQFCKGLRVSQILVALKRDHGIDLTREEPYEILRWAASNGRLRYLAPQESVLAQRLVAEYSWLEQARVVRSAEPLDVAQQAAQLLAEIIREHKGSDIHLGFAGGGLVAETVRLLTGLLQTADELLVKRFIVHALVAAPHDPRRNPNRFLQWFLEPDLPFETTFVGLPAPAVVNWETLDALRSIEGIAEAFDRAHEIDIIVTSAGAHWDKGCSALRKLYETTARPETLHALDQAGCVGDILWQPLSTSGPIELGAGVRAVTVLDLAALRGFVGAGKRVILILAPCSSCHGPKPEVLSAVLRWEGAITDLVVDSRTAVDFLRSGSPERANSEA